MAIIALALGAIGLVLFVAVLNGIILYYVWPVTMVAVFGLPTLTMWQSICLTWVAGILVKSTQTNNNKGE